VHTIHEDTLATNPSRRKRRFHTRVSAYFSTSSPSFFAITM
jgi:hypothetical protein